MLVTVTNLSSSLAVNTLDAYTGPDLGPATLNATGGGRVRPLPYPFAHVELAASGSKQLPMHAADWTHKSAGPAMAMFPHTEWNQVVQSGLVSFAIADQTAVRDQEELFDIQVG